MMEDNSKELNILLEQAKSFLDAKVEQLTGTTPVDTQVDLKIKELEKRIEALEDYTKDIEELYATNPNVLINFRKRINKNKNEIELIKL